MRKTVFSAVFYLIIFGFAGSSIYAGAGGTCPSAVNIPGRQTVPSDLEATPLSLAQNFKLVSTEQTSFGGYVRRNFIPSFMPSSWKYVWETTPGAPIVEERRYASPSPSLRPLRPHFLNYNFIEEIFYSSGSKIFVQTKWRTKSGHWHIAVQKPDGTFLIAEEEDVLIQGNTAEKGKLLSMLEVQKCQEGVKTLIVSYTLPTALRLRKDYYSSWTWNCK